MLKSPQQEIFTLCRQVAIEVVGEKNTYDYLPGTEAAYPFVFIGEQFSIDTYSKTAVFGKVTQSIHIYHNDNKRRGTTSKIINDILAKMRTKERTRSFYIDIKEVNIKMLTDNTTGTPLLHGVLDLTIHFY